MGRFDDRATQPARGPADILRWRVSDTIAGRRIKDDDPGFVPPARAPDLALIASPAPSLTWIGHATFVLRLGGKLIATDPVWSERLAVIKRKSPPGVALAGSAARSTSSPSRTTTTITSTRRRSRASAPRPLYVTPLGNGRWLEKAGAENIVELDWWQSHTVDGVEITLVPARHWSMRAPWNRNDGLWGGFVYRAARRRRLPLGRHRALRRLHRDRHAPRPHRLGDAAHRRLRAALVHGAAAHEPRGRRRGLRAPRRAHAVRHALGHLQAHRRAARRAAAPHPHASSPTAVSTTRRCGSSTSARRARCGRRAGRYSTVITLSPAGRSAQKVVSPRSLRTPRGSSPLIRTGASGRATTKVAPATGACVCTSSR